MATPSSRRSRTAAQPAALHDAAELAHAIAELLEAAATSRGLTGADRSAWIAAMTVLLEAGLLTDTIGRRAAIQHEFFVIQAGGSAQAAHRQLGAVLGLSRQGVEARLRLVGDVPHHDAPGAATLRAQVYAQLDATRPSATAPA